MQNIAKSYPELRMQVEMATNDMKGSKPSSYIDSSRSRGSATRYNSTYSQILHLRLKPTNILSGYLMTLVMFGAGTGVEAEGAGEAGVGIGSQGYHWPCF